jgi:alanine racemase
MLKKILKAITSPRIKYDPLIKVYIYGDVIRKNFSAFAGKFPNVQIAPVLKSNAYGHGLTEVASILEGQQPPFFVVDSFYEALLLRRAGIKTHILIIGYTRGDLMRRRTLRDIAFTIISLNELRELASSLAVPQLFHLKIDTGMHRQGILPAEIGQAAELIKSNHNLILEGVCTHFSAAEDPDQSFTSAQIAEWNKAAEFFQKQFLGLKYLHAAATPGFLHSSSILGNVARIGKGIYGFAHESFASLGLTPALEVRSIISSLRKISPGEKVGYNLTFESKAAMTLAAVPAGYNEGVDFRLSNKGYFLVHGQPCLIAGRVSMNITSIDVTAIKDVKLEDEVVIISRDRKAPNSVENIAKSCDTIPYEILVHVSPTLRREAV